MEYKDFSFIFFGDTHGYIKDIKEIKGLLNKVKPDFVLSEGLQHISLTSKEKYNNFIKKLNSESSPSFNYLKDLVFYCQQERIKLIGIDLKNFGFDARLKKIVENKIKSTYKDKKKLSKIIIKREKLHVQKIKEFSKLSEKPLVIIVGAWHLREKSILMKSFNNYLAIYPCGEDRKPIYGPTTKKINYCLKIKNDKES